MTRWSVGSAWEIHPTPPDPYQPSLWSAVDASSLFPAIFIKGIDRCAEATDLSYGLGREWWTDAPEPGTASCTLLGQVTNIAIGDPFIVDAVPGPILWTGRVDDVTYDVTPDGWITNITAVDNLANLAKVTKGTAVIAAGQLDAKIEAIAALVGLPALTVVLEPQADPTSGVDTLPILNAEAAPVTDDGLGEYLAALEASSNAIVAIDPDGRWLIQPRVPQEETVVPVAKVNFDVDPCPDEGTVNYASPTRIFNEFTLGGTKYERTASIAKYGRASYEALSKSATPIYGAGGVYYSTLLDSLAGPLRWAQIKVRIDGRLSPALDLDPFDYVVFNGSFWQVLGFSDEVAPSVDVSEWYRTVTLAATTSDLAARPPVVVVPPPTRVKVTVTCDCDKDAYVVDTSSGANTGNGASNNMLVGLLSDGNKCRALMRFNLAPITGKNRKVLKATLRWYTDDRTCHTFGSSPKVMAQRITESWAEGAYSTKCGFSSSNGVVYPGPSVTTSGEKSVSPSGSENTKVEVVITDIVKAWIDSGSTNYGVRLRGYSETASSNRTSLWGRSYSTTSRRPVLVVEYEKDA